MTSKEAFHEYKIPRLPRAALEILQLLQDPNVEIRVLARVIESDPALASRMVRLANSSFFGLTREVSSLQQALVVLGTRTVKMAALSCSVAKAFPKITEPYMALFWRRVLTNATGCRIAAPIFGLDPEEAFLAGMMQDLAMLVFAQRIGDSYRLMVERSTGSRSGIALTMLEKQSFGVSHAELVSRWLEDWRFPDRVVDAIARHHDVAVVLEPGTRSLPLAALLSAVETMTAFLISPTAGNFEAFNQISDQIGDVCSFDRLAQQIELTVGDMANLLELALPAGKSYEKVLQETRELSRLLASTPALLDPETGTLQCDVLFFRLEQEMSLAQRKRSPVTVALVRFRPDAATDENGIVRQMYDLASTLQRLVRCSDSLFRFAEDSLCLIVPECTQQNSEDLALKIDRALLGAAKPRSHHELAVLEWGSVTLKVADSIPDAEEILRQASVNLENARNGFGCSATLLAAGRR